MLITILPPHLHPLRRLSRVCSSDPSIQRVAETRAVHGWIAGKIFIGRDVFESLDQMRTIPALLYSSQAPVRFNQGGHSYQATDWYQSLQSEWLKVENEWFK